MAPKKKTSTKSKSSAAEAERKPAAQRNPLLITTSLVAVLIAGCGALVGLPALAVIPGWLFIQALRSPKAVTLATDMAAYPGAHRGRKYSPQTPSEEGEVRAYDHIMRTRWVLTSLLLARKANRRAARAIVGLGGVDEADGGRTDRQFSPSQAARPSAVLNALRASRNAGLGLVAAVCVMPYLPAIPAAAFLPASQRIIPLLLVANVVVAAGSWFVISQVVDNVSVRGSYRIMGGKESAGVVDSPDRIAEVFNSSAWVRRARTLITFTVPAGTATGMFFAVSPLAGVASGAVLAVVEFAAFRLRRRGPAAVQTAAPDGTIAQAAAVRITTRYSAVERAILAAARLPYDFWLVVLTGMAVARAFGSANQFETGFTVAAGAIGVALLVAGTTLVRTTKGPLAALAANADEDQIKAMEKAEEYRSMWLATKLFTDDSQTPQIVSEHKEGPVLIWDFDVNGCAAGIEEYMESSVAGALNRALGGGRRVVVRRSLPVLTGSAAIEAAAMKPREIRVGVEGAKAKTIKVNPRAAAETRFNYDKEAKRGRIQVVVTNVGGLNYRHISAWPSLVRDVLVTATVDSAFKAATPKNANAHITLVSAVERVSKGRNKLWKARFKLPTGVQPSQVLDALPTIREHLNDIPFIAVTTRGCAAGQVEVLLGDEFAKITPRPGLGDELTAVVIEAAFNQVVRAATSTKALESLTLDGHLALVTAPGSTSVLHKGLFKLKQEVTLPELIKAEAKLKELLQVDTLLMEKAKEPGGRSIQVLFGGKITAVGVTYVDDDAEREAFEMNVANVLGRSGFDNNGEFPELLKSEKLKINVYKMYLAPPAGLNTQAVVERPETDSAVQARANAAYAEVNLIKSGEALKNLELEEYIASGGVIELILGKENPMDGEYPWNDYKDIIESPRQEDHGGNLGVHLGMNTQGEPHYLKMFNSSLAPHLAIGGQNGSGKSFIIQSIYAQLVNNYTPDQVQLWIGDPKGVDFAAFRGAPHTSRYIESKNSTPGCSATEEWMNHFVWLRAEADRRHALFLKLGDVPGVKECLKIADYEKYRKELNLSTDEFPPMPLIVIGMDECHEVLDRDEIIPGQSAADAKALHDEAIAEVAWITAKTRSYGFVMILATQHPKVEAFGKSQIRANCNTLGLKMNSSGASMLGLPTSISHLCREGNGRALMMEDSGNMARFRGWDMSGGITKAVVEEAKKEFGDGPCSPETNVAGKATPVVDEPLFDVETTQGNPEALEKEEPMLVPTQPSTPETSWVDAIIKDIWPEG